ncbi:hypothetical protein PG999_012622 [Apiospora kogelbergensis]|uniref:Uncharacterized protein n=1 Tax=Apiospora kogelbergensis TaxID=1337665 RepID=A0AAW0QD56_9PEZI
MDKARPIDPVDETIVLIIPVSDRKRLGQQPSRLDKLDISGNQEHVRIGDSIFTVSSDVILAAAIWLQGTRRPPELTRVLTGEAKVELYHAAHHGKIEGAARSDSALDLELMVDIRVGALVFVGQCTDDIALGNGVPGRSCALNDAWQHGAPVEARKRIGETAGARKVKREFVPVDISIWSRAVLSEQDQGGVGGETGLTLFKGDGEQDPAATVALERNTGHIGWQHVVAISTVEEKDQTGWEGEDEV